MTLKQKTDYLNDILQLILRLWEINDEITLIKKIELLLKCAYLQLFKKNKGLTKIYNNEQKDWIKLVKKYRNFGTILQQSHYTFQSLDHYFIVKNGQICSFKNYFDFYLRYLICNLSFFESKDWEKIYFQLYQKIMHLYKENGDKSDK